MDLFLGYFKQFGESQRMKERFKERIKEKKEQIFPQIHVNAENVEEC